MDYCPKTPTFAQKVRVECQLLGKAGYHCPLATDSNDGNAMLHELAVATEFVQAMSGDLQMEKYVDQYQANLQALIEAKKAGVAPWSP
jgi:hypothetical protein